MRRRSPAPSPQRSTTPAAAAEAARQLRERVAGGFTVETMVDGVLAGYRDALEMLQKAGRR